MAGEIWIGIRVLRVMQGDITEQAVDAIVNAASSSLLGGGGVDGAIHRRGGPEILSECREIRRTRYPSGLPTGSAVATSGGALPALCVIHTVGPVWRGGGSGEAELLRAAYRSAMGEAARVGARTAAFPSISTGAFGYPVDQAARIAVAEITDRLTASPGAVEEVRIVCFSAADEVAYRRACEERSSGGGGAP
jgi:O-acetyl-ADP-ribose deacetylase